MGTEREAEPDPIRAIARQHLRSPVELEVESGLPTTDHVTQQICIVPRARRLEALGQHGVVALLAKGDSHARRIGDLDDLRVRDLVDRGSSIRQI